MIMLRPLDEGHVLALLEKKLGQQADRTDVLALASGLEYIPLAIAQASAYITERAPRCSISQYLALIQRSNESMVNLLCTDADELQGDYGAKNSIMLTWQISFEHIRQLRISAADLLSLMSFFNHQEIPESLLHVNEVREPIPKHLPPSVARAPHIAALTLGKRVRTTSGPRGMLCSRTAGSEDNCGDGNANSLLDQAFEEDIITLRDYQFISAAPGGTTFEMHHLVQLATQKWLEASSSHQQWAEQSVRHLDWAFPDIEEDWQMCRSLYPHAKLALELKLEGRNACIWRASVLYKAGWFARMQLNDGVVEKLMVQAFEARDNLLGKEHIDALFSVVHLYVVLHDQGKHEAAETVSRRFLSALKKELGKDHPTTLRAIDSLSVVQAAPSKQEAVYQELLRRMEKGLGEEDPATLAYSCNIAMFLGAQGKYDIADAMYRQALMGQEKVLGREHPETPATVSGWSIVLALRGEYKPAAAMTQRAVLGKQKVLGLAHPRTLYDALSLVCLFDMLRAYHGGL